MEVGIWASIVSATLTAVTALLALRIAARQAKTSERQLNVDLYHLRVVLFDKIANTEARINHGIDLSHFIDDLKGDVQRTEHLFGPPAKADLMLLIEALIDFDVARGVAEPNSKPSLLDRVHDIRRHKNRLIQAMKPKVNLYNMDTPSEHPLAWIDDVLDWVEGKSQ